MDHRREAELQIDLHARHHLHLRDIATSFWRIVSAGVGAALAGILDALHESRRRQSAREIARHRHLMDAINARTDKWEGEREGN